MYCMQKPENSGARERERMEAKYQALPPLKRYRLLQQQQQQQQEEEHIDHAAEEDYKENLPISLQLPAKKRNESRPSQLFLPDEPTTRLTAAAAPAITTSYCLPTKKRIRALQADYFSSSSGKPLLPLDLNVEYKPSFDVDEDKKTPFAIGSNQCEIAPIHEISNLKENPFGDGSNHSIETDKEGKEKKKIQFVSSTDVQSTEIAEQDEKGGDQGRKKQEEEAEAEDDGILCAICQSTDGDPADPIVFCDGCDLMVHSTCYGNPLAKGIPEDDWFCSRCLISRSQEQRMPISCCLCPSKNGALKPTKNESWAHIVCALFVPEVFFEDPDGREGIDCSMVPKRRWGGKCYMCQRRKGCVIECSESKCSLAFHVTCALDGGLCIEYQEGKKKKETIVAGFCKSHTELWRKQQKTGKFKIVAREESEK